jgi:NAD(P)-dependent dehydrogenase (short-subunit alcohol dehydrogenase family)
MCLFTLLLCVTVGTSHAQDRVFDWTRANDESLQMDPADYHTGRVYRPAPDGGNIHVDIEAKAGVNALTRTWARELGGFGIRFVSIAPGFINTDSTRKALSEANLSRLKEQIPLRRLGEVEHVYQTVRFIVENDYVNGAVLEIDGGLVM